jgi:putative glycosyltransferase (TIGR04372 family)
MTETSFISTGFGPDQLPYIYRKKILYVNWSRFNEICSFSPNIITIFKHYYSEETKKRLSMKEIFEQNKINFFKKYKDLHGKEFIF